jgi:MoaA/NifB/PqqE/SkfB family radical SAM enzyme
MNCRSRAQLHAEARSPRASRGSSGANWRAWGCGQETRALTVPRVGAVAVRGNLGNYSHAMVRLEALSPPSPCPRHERACPWKSAARKGGRAGDVVWASHESFGTLRVSHFVLKPLNAHRIPRYNVEPPQVLEPTPQVSDPASVVSVSPPALIMLAITSRCNLRCVMCEHSIMKVEKKDFDLDLIDRMGPYLASAEKVDLTGLGDALLSKSFWEILDRYPNDPDAPDSQFFLSTTTNGTNLTDVNIKRILHSRMRFIRVSIDAADETTFREIRKTDLAPIADGTRRLIAARNANGRRHPHIGLHMTWMKKTLEGVPAMIDLAKSVGADFLYVFPIHERATETLDMWVQRDGGPFNYRDNMLSGVARETIEGLVNEFHAYGDLKGQIIASFVFGQGRASPGFPDAPLPERAAWKENSIRCPLPWSEALIHYDGDVAPCCWGKPFGSLRHGALEEVWNGSVAQETRSDLIEGCVPKICSGAACPWINGKG